MQNNGKEDAVGCEIMRKRTLGKGGGGGGGADKRGGAHSRYQFFRCGKIGGGGRINDGGRSGGTLRYNRWVNLLSFALKFPYFIRRIITILIGMMGGGKNTTGFR